MVVQKTNSNLPHSDRIDIINDQTVELDGKNSAARFNKHEIESLYSGSGFKRQYVRDYSFSQSTGAGSWYNWAWVKDETGYSIWKHTGNVNYSAHSNNEVYFDDRLVAYKGTATSETATSFAAVFTYDGSDYTDNTVEAGTEGGTAFNLLGGTDDYVYIGATATHTGIRFQFDVFGANNTLLFEYSEGSGVWTELSTTEFQLVDGTSNLRRDSGVTFLAPSNWAEDSVNGSTKYWIRISTTTAPVTTATGFAILPYTSVPTLLALSSADVTAENWKFCDFNNVIYVTFRNDGSSSYEGNRFVKSSSTEANQQNFFRFNHTVTGNYQDSSYYDTGAGLNVKRADGIAPLQLEDESGIAPLVAMTGTAPAVGSKTGAGIFVPVTWNGTNYWIELNS